MTAIAEALRSAEVKLAEAREYLTLAHSLSCKPVNGSYLAEVVTLDLLGAARELENRLAWVSDAIKEDAKP